MRIRHHIYCSVVHLQVCFLRILPSYRHTPTRERKVEKCLGGNKGSVSFRLRLRTERELSWSNHLTSRLTTGLILWYHVLAGSQLQLSLRPFSSLVLSETANMRLLIRSASASLRDARTNLMAALGRSVIAIFVFGRALTYPSGLPLALPADHSTSHRPPMWRLENGLLLARTS